MNAANVSQDIKSQSKIPIAEKEHGYFNSSTVNLPVRQVFTFCQNEENIKRVLADLPDTIENFLDLQFIGTKEKSEDHFEARFENKSEAKVQGSLVFTFKKAPGERGTILSAFALFDKFSWKDNSPSDLMNIFLKRLKALAETGEIATTKGQPSGREELKKLH